MQVLNTNDANDANMVAIAIQIRVIRDEIILYWKYLPLKRG
jgi:hypothetical protein